MKNKVFLSPYAHLYKFGGINVLYNALTLKKVYGGKELSKIFQMLKLCVNTKKIESEYTKLILFLERENFLDGNDIFLELKKKVSSEPKINVMHLLLTDDCNFSCKYCIARNHMKPNYSSDYMTKNIAKRSVDLFSKIASTNEELKIVLYGGEPLLNLDIVKFVIPYIRKRIGEGVAISIATNGSLITEEIARLAFQHNVNVVVSIDGLEHDKIRTYKKNNTGTLKDCIKGMHALKKIGVNTSICVTFGKHNLQNIDKSIDFLLKEGFKEIKINILKRFRKKQSQPTDPYLLNKKLVEILIKLQPYGIEEQNLMRRIKPFLSEEFYYKDCKGYGNEISISPAGNVSPCHIFNINNERKFIIGNVKDLDIEREIKNHPVMKRFCMRTPINMKQCKNCDAIGICGGGCAYEAFLGGDSIYSLDEDFCVHAKESLRWLLKDLIKLLPQKNEIYFFDKDNMIMRKIPVVL